MRSHPEAVSAEQVLFFVVLDRTECTDFVRRQAPRRALRSGPVHEIPYCAVWHSFGMQTDSTLQAMVRV